MGEAELRHQMGVLRQDIDDLKAASSAPTRVARAARELFPAAARVTNVTGSAPDETYDWILQDKDGDVAELTGTEAKNRGVPPAELEVDDVAWLDLDQKDGVFFFVRRSKLLIVFYTRFVCTVDGVEVINYLHPGLFRSFRFRTAQDPNPSRAHVHIGEDATAISTVELTNLTIPDDPEDDPPHWLDLTFKSSGTATSVLTVTESTDDLENPEDDPPENIAPDGEFTITIEHTVERTSGYPLGAYSNIYGKMRLSFGSTYYIETELWLHNTAAPPYQETHQRRIASLVLAGVEQASWTVLLNLSAEEIDEQFEWVITKVRMYRLTVDVFPYLTGSAAGRGLYEYNEVADVEAFPDAGWEFDHWEGEEIDGSEANPASVTMDANKSVTAVFVPT